MVTKKALMRAIGSLEGRVKELEARISELEKAAPSPKEKRERDAKAEKAQAERIKALMDFRPKHVFSPDGKESRT